MRSGQTIAFIEVPSNLADNERGAALATSFTRQSIADGNVCYSQAESMQNASLGEVSVVDRLTELLRCS